MWSLEDSRRELGGNKAVLLLTQLEIMPILALLIAYNLLWVFSLLPSPFSPASLELPPGRVGDPGAPLTCESLRPSLAASFFLSGLLMYFCFWNIFSSALRCTSEKTARRSIPRRGLPRAASGQEKVPGMGTTAEAAVGGTQSAEKSGTGPHHPSLPFGRALINLRPWKGALGLSNRPPFEAAMAGIRSINSNVENGSMVAGFVGSFKGLRPEKAKRGVPAKIEV